jgi:hypothetical protein
LCPASVSRDIELLIIPTTTSTITNNIFRLMPTRKALLLFATSISDA